MNEKKLLRAIGQIEEDFIMEAKDNSKKVKKLYFRKIAVIAIAATMMLGVGAWAANTLITTRVSSSSSIPEFTSLPTSEKMEEILGAKLNLPEEFTNGYKFESAYILDNKNIGEDDSVVEKFGSIAANYKKGNEKVLLSVDPTNSASEQIYGELIETHKDLQLYYTSYTSKMVPPNYKMTEEDKADEASGKYIFSYGSDKVYTMEIQGLTWRKANNLDFDFTVMDSSLTKADLVNMAKELIDAQ